MKLTIYKYSRYCDDDERHITYSHDKEIFLNQQKEDLEDGFSIEDDTIETITFNANDLESLCEALND